MVIVTGANGFIGSVMVWELNQKGVTDIVAVDSVSLSERNLLAKRSIKKFLLKDELWAFLDSDEAKKNVTWIIHMGACSSTTETNKEFLWENNTYYTQRIFEWCTQHSKSMIYASSAATYGAGELGFDDTTDPEKLRPLNLYGESKVLFDRWALKQTKTPPHWYGLKFFNVFGPNEYHKEAMSSVAFKAYNQINSTGVLSLFKSADPKYKDGEFMRDFVYVKDVTGWMAELMDKKPANGVYNMGFGKPRTWLDLAGSVFSAMKKDMNINWLEMPENIRGQYQYFTEAKTDKWLKAGMSPAKWPLEKAVADYVQNYLSKDDPSL
ncbi:ADP-glyceromanno-heptose 6-epimerase [Bdellovibrio reynosensis]|uniref:ADP-glyceromanno-heptose 6-epimerase n=1 Tax=Bdellovibrio reynosensis TaxID=2835041 RepID=A0ABY4C745_9BACT|nr:ADP-glyceromanno-heptose 6-epimerase [Bdellovibrio reynosensis]UOF00740.1 ADP-glyceromanno-heptose 6-epimerase [Bdellovibrio reynosensis]